MWSQEEDHLGMAIETLASLIPWAYDSDQVEEYEALLVILKTVTDKFGFDWLLAQGSFIHAAEAMEATQTGIPMEVAHLHKMVDICDTYIQPKEK